MRDLPSLQIPDQVRNDVERIIENEQGQRNNQKNRDPPLRLPDTLLSGLHLSAHDSVLPFHSDLLAVRP